MPTQDPEKIVQYVTKHRAVPVKKPKLNMINWNKVGMHTMQNTRTLWKNNKEQKNIIRKNLNIWDNLEQTKNKQNSCFSDSMVGLNSAVLLLRFLLKIRSIRILDTIVCSGTLLWLFSPAWDAIKLTLQVGFICPFVGAITQPVVRDDPQHQIALTVALISFTSYDTDWRTQ